MARYEDDEPRPADPDREPMHARVTVLEKRFREVERELEALVGMSKRALYELGID